MPNWYTNGIERYNARKPWYIAKKSRYIASKPLYIASKDGDMALTIPENLSNFE